MLAYVIWGCGKNGRKLLNCLGRERVVAFIDSNRCLVGTLYKNIPIISFDDYLKSFQEYFIVISPNICVEDIEAILRKNGISQYFILLHSPGELPAYNDRLPFSEMLLSVDGLYPERMIVLFGINLFSVILYDFLLNSGYSNVYFFKTNEEKTIASNIFFRDADYKFLDFGMEDECAQILITDRHVGRTNKLNFDNGKEFYWFPHLKRYHIRDLSIFHNIHKEERCFVIGNGPSLLIDDLNKLKFYNEKSFGVNRIYRAFDLTDWRPYYYCCEDISITNYDLQMIFDADIRYKFISNRLAEMMPKRLMENNIYIYPSIVEYYEDDGVYFSDNPNNGIQVAGTVLYDCLQFAVYMGFKEIFLMGADCQYRENGNDKDYFIEGYSDPNDASPNLNYDRLWACYERAYEYAKEHGIKIYNATRGGVLDIFPRVDFDSLFD